MKIVAFIGSSRPNGNTEVLTDVLLENINVRKVYLKDLTIKPIEDMRHTEEGFPIVDDDYDLILDAILESDMLVFSTPIYWYSATGLMKNMIDRISQAIRDQRYPNLKEHLKTVETFVVAVGGDNPRIKGLPLIQQFKYTFDFLNMPFTGYVIGRASKPKEILQDKVALSQARLMNEQIKKLIQSREQS
ncbi:NAD(P)H-dependent oxidoreductase [Ureibacillus massiliensis 4400831 = CIP 108448 = CCUG 49529]|uniref:NAD(P)H-dependent oxidoreductase n=2 Tax=cellular organisms TaxID=131567 RepID=A0A0A3J3Z2_9BACL|nr:flavodoxin family protein [Ureibacillus massiliensis]KGR91744.1 NAD(P)H-dependent oxidoreductase [Ureibacillus massiliensis 4400831 = CIP 108448 = CCUG 49529]RKJ66757.1 flavodoxin family protein [Butyricicoccus sp. 1XD8-22]BDH63502.1 putative NAD(P)H-dependent FMN-containing oxidoreductase YwqN [Lysinibacillus sp. PLM2]